MDIIVKAAPKDELGEAVRLLEMLLRGLVKRFIDAHQGDGSDTSE